MKKQYVGVALGAVVIFGWGMVSWMVLPWHNNTIKKLPEEQLISDTLKTVVTEPGIYFFPSDHTSEGRLDEKVWTEKYKHGPIGVLAFSPLGKEPMGGTTFLVAILGNLLIAVITMVILCLARDRLKRFFSRALFVMMFGMLVSLAVHLPYWNWFTFPWDFTLVAMMDSVVAFLLLGLSQAKFVPEP